MRPLLHPSLVNGRWGDPALYIETLFEKRAILFDLGDISALPTRNIHRLDHIFVSHAHIDHFIGFDHLLRVLVGREKTISIYGPAGFIDQVRHKLMAYRWNLVGRYACDLVCVVTEVGSGLETRSARFRFKTAFAQEPAGNGDMNSGVLYAEPGFAIRTAVLDHRTPCLAFAIEEAVHVNVWKNRVEDRGLVIGAWLHDLKQAVTENMPDDHVIRARSGPAAADVRDIPLGQLRGLVTITPGQKIAYVTDVADTPANRAAIVRLVAGADLLFIEAAFAEADADLAAERAHLTTAAAGSIARAANVRRVEPFHFSPRYGGEETRMLDEVAAAFTAREPERVGG